MTEITIGDPVPGLTLYTITCREARQLPGPQQDIERLQEAMWGPTKYVAPNELAEIVHKHPIRRGVSANRLSLQIGASHSYVNQIEQGLNSFPRAYLYPLAEALSIPIGDLLMASLKASEGKRMVADAQAA